jgi:hypothetical protein
MINDRNSPSRASMADALDGVNMSAEARAAARANLRKAEAIINGAEILVRSIRRAIDRIGELSAAWRLKTLPRA